MSAVIKASPSLVSGGLVVVSQEVSVQSASELSLDAEYLCLANNAARWTAALRVGAQPPLPPPETINYYNLLSPLTLAGVTVNVRHGLCYFSCQFTAPRDPTTPIDGENPVAPQFETTTQSIIQQQQLSGSANVNTSRWQCDPQTREWKYVQSAVSRPWAFVYNAETKTVTASTESLLGGDPSLFIGSLYISEPRFLQGNAGLLAASRPSGGGARDIDYGNRYAAITSYRSETSVSSTGQRRYSLTGSIQYYVQ